MKSLIVGCLHGDENLGKQVIKTSKIKEVDYLIANSEALEQKKRFIDVDMNRCFPGKKKGNYEERQAYNLNTTIKSYDLVVDIHSTKSDIKELIIVSSLSKKIRNLLKYISIKNIVLMPKKMCKGSLIAHCSQGISLEYKRKTNPIKVITHIKQVITKKKEYKHNFYKVIGEYKVDEPFKFNSNLRELKEVKVVSCIGKTGKIEYAANLGLIPLFLGMGRYKGTACLRLKKII